MSILLSIIVPVYNVGSFLPKCIDSIISQTFTDFELILVDDGSTDNSVEICDAAAKKDSRVRVIHKENGGVVSARKQGFPLQSANMQAMLTVTIGLTSICTNIWLMQWKNIIAIWLCVTLNTKTSPFRFLPAARISI